MALQRIGIAGYMGAGKSTAARLLAAQGKSRLEEVAFLFLRAQRSLPTELAPYGNLDRFARMEQAAQEQQLVRQLESWLFPPRPAHFDSPRAFVRAVCRPHRRLLLWSS